MAVRVRKTTFENFRSRVTHFRIWNKFYNKKFRIQLKTKLSLENFYNSSKSINKFLEIRVNTFDIFAPHKKKYLLGNNMSFMSKYLINAHKKTNSPKKQVS